MKIPLYKLFLIQAAYAIALGAFRRLGTVGIVSGLVVGTALSGLILLVRKDGIQSFLTVGMGSIIGGFLGLGCLGDALLSSLHGYDHGFGEGTECAIMGGIIGVVVGGVFSSYLLHRARKW
jgi:predicted membrane protein